MKGNEGSEARRLYWPNRLHVLWYHLSTVPHRPIVCEKYKFNTSCCSGPASAGSRGTLRMKGIGE